MKRNKASMRKTRARLCFSLFRPVSGVAVGRPLPLGSLAPCHILYFQCNWPRLAPIGLCHEVSAYGWDVETGCDEAGFVKAAQDPACNIFASTEELEALLAEMGGDQDEEGEGNSNSNSK